MPPDVAWQHRHSLATLSARRGARQMPHYFAMVLGFSDRGHFASLDFTLIVIIEPSDLGHHRVQEHTMVVKLLAMLWGCRGGPWQLRNCFDCALPCSYVFLAQLMHFSFDFLAQLMQFGH